MLAIFISKIFWHASSDFSITTKKSSVDSMLNLIWATTGPESTFWLGSSWCKVTPYFVSPAQIAEEVFDYCIADDPKTTRGIGGDNMTCIIICIENLN